MRRKTKCTVCGLRFMPDRSIVYEAVERKAPLEALTKPPLVYNAVDCPRCGCQIALHVRDARAVVERDDEEGSGKA